MSNLLETLNSDIVYDFTNNLSTGSSLVENSYVFDSCIYNKKSSRVTYLYQIKQNLRTLFTQNEKFKPILVENYLDFEVYIKPGDYNGYFGNNYFMTTDGKIYRKSLLSGIKGKPDILDKTPTENRQIIPAFDVAFFELKNQKMYLNVFDRKDRLFPDLNFFDFIKIGRKDFYVGSVITNDGEYKLIYTDGTGSIYLQESSTEKIDLLGRVSNNFIRDDNIELYYLIGNKLYLKTIILDPLKINNEFISDLSTITNSRIDKIIDGFILFADNRVYDIKRREFIDNNLFRNITTIATGAETDSVVGITLDNKLYESGHGYTVDYGSLNEEILDLFIFGVSVYIITR